MRKIHIFWLRKGNFTSMRISKFILIVGIVGLSFCQDDEDRNSCSEAFPGPVDEIEWKQINQHLLTANPPRNLVYRQDMHGRNFTICRARTSTQEELVPGRVNMAVGGCEIFNRKTLTSERKVVFEVLLSSNVVHWQDGGNPKIIPKLAIIGGCDSNNRNTYVCRCPWGNEIGAVYGADLTICWYATGSSPSACHLFEYLVVTKAPLRG